MNRVILLILFFVFVLLGVFSVPLYAQSTAVPMNGCFQGGLSGWSPRQLGNPFGTPNFSWDSGGANGCGSVRLSGAEFHSFPVQFGSGAVLTFWARASWNLCSFVVYLFSYSSGQVSELAVVCLTTSWQQYSYTIPSAQVNSVVGIVFVAQESSPSYYLSDVRLSNSTNFVRDGYDINGQFIGGAYWLYGQNAMWSGQVGHDDIGSIDIISSPGSFFSIPFCSGPYTSWSFWAYQQSGSPNIRLRIYDYSGVSYGDVYNVNQSVTSWTQFPFSLSGYQSKCVQFVFGSSSGANYLFFDDVCPAGGCVRPPTPTPTSAYPPWPTFPPWPTHPPYPTQMPYPTPYYGLGTPMPVEVVNTVVVTGSVRIDNLPGNGTPLPVYFPTRHITVPAIPPGAGQGGGMGVNAPKYVAQVDARNNSGILPLYKPGSSAPPLQRDGIVVREYSGGLCLPDQLDTVVTGIDKCFNFNYMMISEWYVMGQNILPAFTIIFGVLTLFVIWKQIQKR